MERRKPARRGDRSIPRARLDKLFTDNQHGLRERVLWRMLYETAARAEEILSLNIEDLDLEFRRRRVTSNGGATEYVHWATGTARLLPRLLRGCTTGPVFLADRRVPASGPRAPQLPTTPLTLSGTDLAVDDHPFGPGVRTRVARYCLRRSSQRAPARRNHRPERPKNHDGPF
ncbi:site-specific integrase [Nonomuraea lactucae]|uniref:site-specific integrase n=1 Tax=Nonomuraea lactucae TaxID=2249762 RepID=UPI00196365F9|nr:site-specific integrase [Nonomuraea lactucae]